MPMGRDGTKDSRTFELIQPTNTISTPIRECCPHRNTPLQLQQTHNKRVTKENRSSVSKLSISVGPSAPTQSQIDIVRYTWERIIETRLPTDNPTLSPAHAFGFALYSALFDIDNDLRIVFANVLQQSRALAGMIAYIVQAPSIHSEQGLLARCCPSLSPAEEGAVCEMARPSYHPHDSHESKPSLRTINARKRANYSQKKQPSFTELIKETASSGCASGEAAEAHEEMNPERLRQRFQRLGERHYGYRVEPHHLAYMGPAVNRVLKERLKDDFLPEIEDAWQTTNAFATYHMKVGLENQKIWEGEHQGVHRHLRTLKNGGCSLQ